MGARFLSLILSVSAMWQVAQGDVPQRVLPAGELPADSRLGPLKDLNGYFPFQPVETREAWEQKAPQLRNQIRAAMGLLPAPTKTPLNAVIHSPVERPEYTVWRVYFESMPGHYVTGSLYRPKGKTGPLPAVLSPHGHWNNGRFHEWSDKEVRELIAVGAERFLQGGRHPLQARCVQLARMGCVVFFYDMIGYADSVQLDHRPGVREAMNTPENWGFFSPQAELRLQSMAGLQTWNSIRALDFLCSLPEVDAKRIAVTGASGGGTQTMILSAIDERIAAALPAVMVSTAMQGGCTCENACHLRAGLGNIEIAALTAPRPLGLTAADDWTKELQTKGYPDLKRLFELLGKADAFQARFHTNFPHNYNSVNRVFMYGFMNDAFGLGMEKPILEEDYEPLNREELTVWTEEHPRPSGDNVGDAHERKLLAQWSEDAQRQIEKLDASSDEYRKLMKDGWTAIIGGPSDATTVAVEHKAEGEESNYAWKTGLIRNQAAGYELPAVALVPLQQPTGFVLWFTDEGKVGLFDADGELKPAIRELLAAGKAIIGVDLLSQGEFLSDGKPLSEARLNLPTGDKPEPWQYAAAYTFGYNRPLFCQRVQDVLATVAALRKQHPSVSDIGVVGVGREAGPVVLAASALATEQPTKTAVATDSFQFEQVNRFDDPMFVPGAARYKGIAGLASLVKADQLLLSEGPLSDGSVDEIVAWLTD